MNDSDQTSDNQTTAALRPVTDADVARYLRNQPGFFERESTLLADIRLYSQHGERAVSLSERQADLLRERIRHLESELHGHADLIERFKANARANLSISERLNVWVRDILLTTDDSAIPAALGGGIRAHFGDLQAAVKVWGVSARFANEPFAMGASADVLTFAKSLGQPYCGINSGFEAVQWLDDPQRAQSVAMIALRSGAVGEVVGLLILASADIERFKPEMATDFLSQIGDLASAALSRLRT